MKTCGFRGRKPKTDTLNGVDLELAMMICVTIERSNSKQIAKGLGRAKLRYKTITYEEEQENKIALAAK